MAPLQKTRPEKKWAVIVKGKTQKKFGTKEEARHWAEDQDFENYRIVTQPLMDQHLYF